MPYVFLIESESKEHRLMVDLDLISMIQIAPDNETPGNDKVAMLFVGTNGPVNVSLGRDAAQAFGNAWLGRGKPPPEQPLPQEQS